ncbi:hypothetical protein TYRP_005777 [Tyrophagus putrescentiae]|nr:hypothetical protein TYRP_005777 [Tyrophagus putrescentiae]
MFSVDEAVKSLFFPPPRPEDSKQDSPIPTSSSTFAYLLDHHWDQLVVTLLVAPLQWLHISHLLYSTEWLTYGAIGKLLLLLYITFCFAFWEELRLYTYLLARRLQSGDSLPELVAKLCSAGREVHKHTAPLVGEVTRVVSKVGVQVGGQAAQMIAGKIGGGGAGGAGRTESSPRSPLAAGNSDENFTRRSEKMD